MIEWIKDKYLTWSTGQDKSTRLYNKWVDDTVVQRAGTIENMFMNFKYIIPVSTQVFDLSEPFGWIPCEDFKQYLYPARTLGNNAVYCFARGYRDKWGSRFHLNDMYHEQDRVFVATNSEADAVMIALKFS